MIRASINFSIPNQSMKRSRCVQSPRVEDFIYGLQVCKIHKTSSSIQLTLGNYRPQQLLFGMKFSQDVFDEAMFRIFGDIYTPLLKPKR